MLTFLSFDSFTSFDSCEQIKGEEIHKSALKRSAVVHIRFFYHFDFKNMLVLLQEVTEIATFPDLHAK